MGKCINLSRKRIGLIVSTISWWGLLIVKLKKGKWSKNKVYLNK